MRTPCLPPEFRTWPMSDGYTLHGRYWPAPASHAALGVIYLHGIQSHGAWFEGSAALLAQTGVPVVLPDRRGSGLNALDRGDTPSAERWLADIDELTAWLTRVCNVTRIALIGVSWGGKLAVAWALRQPERAAKLLLVAPGLFPAVDVGLLGRMRIGAALLRGGARMFPIPLNDPKLFTDNPAGRAFIAADPLKLTAATARFFYHSSRLDRRLVRAAAGSLRPPVTLALAENDCIIRKRPTETWLRRLALRSVEVCVFPGACHTLEFEPDPQPYDSWLGRWLREGLPCG